MKANTVPPNCGKFEWQHQSIDNRRKKMNARENETPALDIDIDTLTRTQNSTRIITFA